MPFYRKSAAIPSDCVVLHQRWVKHRLLRPPCQRKYRSISIDEVHCVRGSLLVIIPHSFEGIFYARGLIMKVW